MKKSYEIFIFKNFTVLMVSASLTLLIFRLIIVSSITFYLFILSITSFALPLYS